MIDPTLSVNLKLLQTFILVAQHTSFREAGDVLGRSQSAVSTQIKRLEEQLGTPLFYRTTRTVRLTHEGEMLLQKASLVMESIGQTLKSIQERSGSRQVSIRLACSPTIASTRLPAIIAQYARQFPEVQVLVQELQSQQLYAAVREGAVDFGLGPSVSDPDLTCATVMIDPIMAIVPERYLPHAVAEIDFQQLAGWPVIMLSGATAMRRLIESQCQRLGLKLDMRHQCLQAQTLVAMAEAGLGTALLPQSVLSMHVPNSSRIVDIRPSMQREVSLVAVRGNTMSDPAMALHQLISHQLKLDEKSPN